MRPREHNEDLEVITNYDLVSAAHACLDGIDLDVASSKVAQEFVQASSYYTPTDDGLNAQEWSDSVYLFPPGGSYFWCKKTQRWKKTRSTAITLTSSHAAWFRRLYREWYKGNIKDAIYMTNHPDMIRFDQRMFDFPMCVLRTAPRLIKNTSKGVEKGHKTGTCIIVYMPPHGLNDQNIQRFIDIYSEKGRCIC